MRGSEKAVAPTDRAVGAAAFLGENISMLCKLRGNLQEVLKVFLALP